MAETFFNRIRAAQTDPVRGEIRASRDALQRTNPSGFTPLDFAIDLVANKRGSSVEMVNLLLDEGAQPNFRADTNGPTALHHAVGANDIPIAAQQRLVTMLLKHGADQSLTDYSEQTPSQMCGVRPEILELLSQAGALRQMFLAHGAVPVAHDRPSSPPPVLPWADAGASTTLPQRVGSGIIGAVGGAAQAIGGLVTQGLADLAAAGPQVSVPLQPGVMSTEQLNGLFEPKNGALAMGNDVIVADCRLEEAFRKCLTLDNAVGFTFAPTAANKHDGRLRCYFKSAARGNSDPLWKTYLQKTAAAVVVPTSGMAAAPPVVATAAVVALPVAAVAPVAGGGVDLTGSTGEAESSDYNTRRLEKRIRNLEATCRTLAEMGQDTTEIQEDLTMHQNALAARHRERQTQDLRRTDTAGGASDPPVAFDELAAFEKLRKDELARLETKIEDQMALLKLLGEMGEGHATEKIEKELHMDQMQRDKYRRLLDEAAAAAVAAEAEAAFEEPEPEPEPEDTPSDTGMIIDCTDLTVKEQVGVGAFKDVHKGLWQGGEIAVLKLRNPDERQRAEFMAEAAIFVQLGNHQNVLRYFGRCEPDAATGEGFHALVTELARHRSLDDFLEITPRSPQMPIRLKQEAAAQIACGMAHMHDRGVIHRDLAARNVLVSVYDVDAGRIEVQLTDYGLSRNIASSSRYQNT